MSRITLEMSAMEAVIALAEGNIGAATACGELLKSSELGLVDLCHLDDMELYGPNIWLGYKDICEFDVVKFQSMIKDRSLAKAVKDLPHYYEVHH